MRTLATLQDPDEGEILLDGWNIFSDRQQFRRMLGYLPRDFGVYPNASAVDLLDYFARLKGIANERKRKAHVHYLLELVNLTQARNKNVDTFSGGMRQRFGIAQTLISNPRVIIVDEPTAGLDPAERNRFYGILHCLGDNAIVMLTGGNPSEAAFRATQFKRQQQMMPYQNAMMNMQMAAAQQQAKQQKMIMNEINNIEDPEEFKLARMKMAIHQLLYGLFVSLETRALN